jgi:hypothetical protein
MRHYDLQVTDIIGSTDERPLGFGFNGTNGTQKWEIIHKERRRPRFRVTVAKVPLGAVGTIDFETFPEAQPAVPTGDNRIFKLDGTEIVNNALGLVLHK